MKTPRTPSTLIFASLFFCLVCGLAHGAPAHAFENASSDADTTVRFSAFHTHSRLTFRIEDDVPVEWKEVPGGFEAFFKGLSLVDLGAPLGDEAAWSQRFEKIDDPRLASLSFHEVPGGVKMEGKWKFATGPNAPAEPRMELFQYRDKNPPRFIVDYWVKPGPTIADIKALQKKNAKKVAAHKAQEQIQARVNRRIATEKAREEQNDLGRFCREPLKDERDIFLPFYAVHEPIQFSKYISTTTPDHDFPYYKPTSKAKDAEYVRLALELYRQGKPALVVRTLDFLDAEFPKSMHRHEMQFLRANALIRLGMKPEAEKILERLKIDARGTPVALHAGMFLAARQVERKNFLAAHEAFAWLNENYPDHRLSWLFHLGAAESLYVIRQTERAAKEYQWVVENAKLPEQKAEAALRLGDIYLDRWQYEQALGAYVRGIRYFPKQAAEFPAVHLNRAEVLVGLHQYDDARKEFEKYLATFPTYPEGWRATLRLGEIWARSESSSENASASEARPLPDPNSRKWFYETINRYPFSPGSTIARLRLLPCGDHGGFTYHAALRFFEGEAMKLDASKQISMVHYPDLRGLTYVRSLITFHHEEKALEVAQLEMQRARSPQVKDEIQDKYKALFRKNIEAMLDQGKRYEALSFFKERSTYLGRDIAAGDPEYLLKLSQAASGLGLGKLGESFAARYQKAVGTTRNLAAEGVQIKPDLDTRLRTSDQRFAEAKAMWISSGMTAEPKIREKLEQVVTESPHALQREIILGVMDEKLGKPVTALGHVAKADLLMGSVAQVSPADRTRVRAWLASLESRVGDSGNALQIYRALENSLKPPFAQKSANDMADLLGVPALPSIDQVLLAEGMILDQKGSWGEAAAAYAKAVDGGMGGNQAMYGYARALLKGGSTQAREKALGILDRLVQSKTDDFWKKMGTEVLAAERGDQKP